MLRVVIAGSGHRHESLCREAEPEAGRFALPMVLCANAFAHDDELCLEFARCLAGRGATPETPEKSAVVC